MAEIDKMMVSDGNGGQKQIYPQTHAAAVIDIEKYAGNGPKGADGKDGANGLSAYEIAKKNGYTGTETEWLASLKGKDGTNGTNATTTAVATQTANGLMSKEDKKKLDGLSNSGITFVKVKDV